MVNFEWNDGVWSYNKNLDDVNINVQGMQEEDKQLNILEPHEAKKMIGVFMAIDGNNITQIAHMRRRSEQWYEKVIVGHLTRFDA